MQKTDFLTRLYLPLVLLYCALQAWRPLGGGFDFWAHAAVGRWIWDHGRPPTTGLFLWSNPGYFWVAHSWLSELFFYFIIRAGGPVLVMVANAFFAVLSFAMVWRFWSRRGPLNFLTPILFALAIYASSSRFQPRQEMLTAVILVVLLAFLVRWRESDTGGEELAVKARLFTPAALGIVALFALWINLHAFVFWGLVMVLITALCDAVQYRLDRRAWILLGISLGCLAATLLNPYHFHYWQAAEQLRPGSQTSYIDEWKPFWKGPRLPLEFVYAEAALVAAALFGWLRNPERRWAQLFWLLLTTAMFLKSRRLLWMLALTCLIIMAANARSFNSELCWQWWRVLTGQKGLGGIPPRMRTLAHAVSVLVVVTALGLCSFDPFGTFRYWPLQTLTADVPVRMAAMIKARPLPGRIFNDYENGSYLQWALNGVDPKTGHVPTEGIRPLYIDLLSAYPDQVLLDYFKVLDALPEGRKILRDNKVNIIYLGAHHSMNPLVDYLLKSPDWQLLDRGQQGFLWVRREPLR